MIENKKKLIPESMPEFSEDIKGISKSEKRKIYASVTMADKIERSGKIVFATHYSELGKEQKQHAFIYEDKSRSSFPVPLLGNISLCGSSEILDEIGASSTLDEIESEITDYKRLCKRCAAIYDKFKNIL